MEGINVKIIHLSLIFSFFVVFFCRCLLINPSCVVTAVVGEDRGFMHQYGLDDWKFALPIGMLVGMPVIANEVWI